VWNCAKFRTNLPASAMGKAVRVIFTPNRFKQNGFLFVLIVLLLVSFIVLMQACIATFLFHLFDPRVFLGFVYKLPAWRRFSC
jgi:hypothetical protein